MSDLVDILHERYQAIVARKQAGEGSDEFLEDVRIFIADAQQAGASVADLNERSQLRAWMRFLADTLYDATGSYPDVTLQPLARGELVHPQAEQKPRPSSPHRLGWALAGGAAAVIIAAGLFLIGWLSRPPEAAEETPTPLPVPFVSEAVVGAELDAGGRVGMAGETFCRGIPEIVAEFTLERVVPGTEWRWEVQRGGTVVAAQPAVPWGTGEQRVTIRALSGGPEGVEPGQYELVITVGEQVVGVPSFQVLDTAPQVSNVRVADVPDPAGESPAGRPLGPGVRVIFLVYEFQGLCPGLEVSHALYRAGSPSRSGWNNGVVPLKARGKSCFRHRATQRFPLVNTRPRSRSQARSKPGWRSRSEQTKKWRQRPPVLAT